MSKFENLQKEMVAAMKARDKERKEAISSLVSAAKKIAIDEGARENITDEIVDRAIVKEHKAVKEQVETCPESRADLKAEYSFRLSVIEEFLPKQLSREEIIALLNEKFAEVVATKNKGQIMKAVMGELKGKADGKLISQAVEELCR